MIERGATATPRWHVACNLLGHMRRTSSSFLVAALLALAGAACDLDTDTTEPSDRAAETEGVERR